MEKVVRHNLYFHDRFYTTRVLLENCTKEEAEIKISEFLKEHHYHAPYWRITDLEGKGYQYDVGSWTEDFVWED